MKKGTVGSILLLLLVINPSLLQQEAFAHEIFRASASIANTIEASKDTSKKNNNNIFVGGSSNDDENNINENNIDDNNDIFEVGVAEVDNLVMHLESNTRKINGLMREKESIVSKVQTTMDFKANANISLSELQILQFVEFTSCYQEESKIIKDELTNITSNDLIDIKNEILDENSDLEYIYYGLQGITDSQYNAIYSLNSIIDIGIKTLEVL